jgi:hypothetical protein
VRAVLEFNLPEDAHDHMCAVKAHDWWVVCWDLDQKLRGQLKHGHEFKTADEALQATRDLLWELLRDHGLDFED